MKFSNKSKQWRYYHYKMRLWDLIGYTLQRWSDNATEYGFVSCKKRDESR